MAAELGRRLLAEVQEVGLDEILQTIRLQHDPEPAHFGISSLDKIINTTLATKRSTTTPPILELTSQGPGSGTTHLLYLLTATAILPPVQGGKDSCVAIIDTDGTFSVSRLVQQLHLSLPPPPPPNNDKDEASSNIIQARIAPLLRHVHIFRPQSQSSLIATLASLPAYFLQPSNPSAHRPLAFIAIDFLTAFHWPTTAAAETRAIETQHPSAPSDGDNNKNQPPNQQSPQPAPQLDLPTTLRITSTALCAPIILTSPSHLPLPHIPTATRLKVQRSAVRSFPPTISIAEAGDRQRAVDASGWEARVVESGLAKGVGFEFRIEGGGVRVVER